jgi:hypothetical protein
MSLFKFLIYLGCLLIYHKYYLIIPLIYFVLSSKPFGTIGFSRSLLDLQPILPIYLATCQSTPPSKLLYVPTRVTRLGKILPFRLLFKGPGKVYWGKHGLFKSILRVQTGFDLDVLDFQIEFCWRYLWLFLVWFGNCFGYFFQNLGKIFPIFLVTLVQTKTLTRNGFYCALVYQ